MNPEWIVPDWPALPNVRAIVSTRFGPGVSKPPFDAFNLGARCGDDPEAVAENRARLIDALSLSAPPCWLRQVHGTNVARFEAAVDEESEADAAVTRTPGVALVILTADCLPVLFCAEDGSEIAAAHAGWRGSSAGVLENTLAEMRSPREKFLAWLGPAIGPKSYEVGEEVRDAFLANDSQAADAFTPTRPGHWHCDLYALARQRLRAAGVTRIFGGGFDTFADPSFYSYRRDGARSGRFATLVWLKTADKSK
jgi:YfiH family protein